MRRFSIDQGTADLFLRPQTPAPDDSFSLSGRTVAGSVSTGALVIVHMGQSHNGSSISGGTYSPTHGSNALNLSIGNKGGLWLAAAPLLIGDGVGDHHGRWLADSLIGENIVPQVILVGIAVSANFAADWAPGGNAYGGGTRPGTLAYRVGLASRCLTKAGLNHLPRIVDFELGHSDSLNSTTQVDFTAAMNKIITECKRTGLLRAATDVMFIHKSTALSATSGQRNAVRAAQAEVVDGTIVRAGADIDTLDASYRYDGVHFSYATGAAAQASLKQTVYETWL